MFKKINDRITAARNNDEITRLSTASRWILIVGIILAVIWIFIILPAQVFLITKLNNTPNELPDTIDAMTGSGSQ